MNDPQVVALIYTVEHGNSVSYKDAKPLRNFQTPEFDLTVEDKIARFAFRKFYATKDEALQAVEPFIRQWEFETGIRWGPNSFSLSFKDAEIIDRNPSPPEPGTIQPGGSIVVSGATIRASGGVTLGMPHYPPPLVGGAVDLEDLDVVKMTHQYHQYRLGRAKLPATAYFCVTVLEKKYEGLPEAAKQCGVSRKVLETIKKLSSTKGGEDARKAEGADVEFTGQEKRFLKEAVEEIIIRAAQVAADDSQRLPQITMAKLPKL